MKKIYIVNDYDLSWEGNSLVLDSMYYDKGALIGAYNTKEEAIEEAIEYIRDFKNNKHFDYEEDEELRKEVWMADDKVLKKSDFFKPITYYIRGNEEWRVMEIICIEIEEKEEI